MEENMEKNRTIKFLDNHQIPIHIEEPIQKVT